LTNSYLASALMTRISLGALPASAGKRQCRRREEFVMALLNGERIRLYLKRRSKLRIWCFARRWFLWGRNFLCCW